ncbi:hypothetical protein KJ784_03540 [Patescibacteria group bacterium]|nr:hypothetical protein [Patescibacteria group bacterium]
MNFLENKKRLVVVVAVLVIVTGAAGVFYWQKVQTLFDISPGAVKAKCIEDVGKMTEDELINELEVLKYAEETDFATGEERIMVAEKGIVNYFICKVANTKDENDYNLAQKSISELSIEEENKKKVLLSLDEAYEADKTVLSTGYSEDETENRLKKFALNHAQLALGDINDICLGDEVLPEYFEMTKKMMNQFENLTDAEMERRFEKAKNLCKVINKYSNGSAFDIDGYLQSIDSWSDNFLVRERELKTRAGLVYRFGGDDYFWQVCDAIPTSISTAKKECEILLSSLEELERCSRYGFGGTVDCGFPQECLLIRNKVEEIICEYPVAKK